MRQFFIRTQDEETKNKLLKHGFTLLNQEGHFYVFINDGNKKNFSEEVQKEIYYTDKLNL